MHELHALLEGSGNVRSDGQAHRYSFVKIDDEGRETLRGHSGAGLERATAIDGTRSSQYDRSGWTDTSTVPQVALKEEAVVSRLHICWGWRITK